MHAEENAMKNFIRMNRKLKRTRVNIHIIRVSRNGQYKNSKPCYHCIQKLANNNLLNIRYVYFSNDEGEISCVKFNDLYLDIENCRISRGNNIL